MYVQGILTSEQSKKLGLSLGASELSSISKPTLKESEISARFEEETIDDDICLDEEER